MSPAARDRLFGFSHAFDNPVTMVVSLVVGSLLLLAPMLIWWLAWTERIDRKMKSELITRYWSWLVITPLILGPILLGAALTIVGIAILSLLCYREYARATGLFREKAVSAVVVLAIMLRSFAELDHWYRLFVALVPFTVGIIAIVAILRDKPEGYIQRVSLGVLGYVLFGSCLGHLGYLANDQNYRPILILIFLSVELNDVFAFIVGKLLGRRKLAPNTSPKKTVAGAVGALVLTTLLVMGLGSLVFRGTVLAGPGYLAFMGMLISILGQFGDLMMSSIKRDLGVKDMAATIPGHGGLLDRFDSIILVGPGVFHFINYFVGVGADQAVHIFTGG
jgi:phosphatidate cytidylyltransferase